MSNLIITPDLHHNSWDKHRYNIILPSEPSPFGNTTGVITFKHKKLKGNIAFCYCYSKNISIQKSKKYKCTIWAKTNDPNWNILMYTGNNQQTRLGRVITNQIKVPSDNNWVKLTWEFINPSHSRVECISFRFNGNARSTQYVHSLYNPVLTEVVETKTEETKTEETKTEETKTEETKTEETKTEETKTEKLKLRKLNLLQKIYQVPFL